MVLRLAHAAGNVAVGDRLVTRIIGDEMGRVRVLDGAAVGEVEFAGFRIREIVRCEGGRGDGESHGRDGGEGEFLEHDVASLFSSSQYLQSDLFINRFEWLQKNTPSDNGEGIPRTGPRRGDSTILAPHYI